MPPEYSLGTGVTDDSEPPCGCWELNPSSSEEQPALCCRASSLALSLRQAVLNRMVVLLSAAGAEIIGVITTAVVSDFSVPRHSEGRWTSVLLQRRADRGGET